MRWLACAIVLLAVGCAPVADHPGNWVISQGHTVANPQDYDDCLHKARYSETFASGSEGPPLYSPPQLDRPLLDICMRAHGYQPK